MEEDDNSWPPEELLEGILLSAGFNEWYLRPLSVLSKRFLMGTNHLKRTLHISNTNAKYLPRLLKRFPFIKHINLPSSFEPELFFSELGRFRIRLESLDMSLMKSFQIRRFTELPPSSLSSLRSLKSLKLAYLEDQVDADGDLGIIADLLPGLEELELPWGYPVTYNGVAMLASKLRELKRISFAGCRLITDTSLLSLRENYKKLEEIALSRCSSLSSQGIKDLLVYVSGNNGNIRMLEFSSTNIPHHMGFYYSIAYADLGLKRISLSDYVYYTLHSIMHRFRDHYAFLEYFAIKHSSADFRTVSGTDAVSHLSRLSNARVVKLNYCCYHVTTEQLLAMIHNCSRLKTLELKGALMCPAQRVEQVTKSQLRSLNLSFSKMLTDECLEQLASACPHLEELFVIDCKAISHRGVDQILKRCSSLRILHMNGCEGVSTLSFNIELAKLEVLEARRSGLDDESLSLIASNCPQLMCLDLSNCPNVTDLGVKQVVIDCKHLWKLGISLKQFAGSNLEYWIRSTRPWLDIAR